MTFTTSWSQKKSDGAVTRRADVLKSRQVTWKCPLKIDNFKAKIISLGTFHSKSFFQIARCFGKYFTFAHKIFWPLLTEFVLHLLKKAGFWSPSKLPQSGAIITMSFLGFGRWHNWFVSQQKVSSPKVSSTFKKILTAWIH